MGITALLVKVKLGSPVIFKQERPGLNGKIFTLYKFRTMTDKKDENGDQYRVYNIGNNKPEKLLTFIETLEEIIGIAAKKEYLPMQPGDVYQTYADVSELEKNFNLNHKRV